MSNGRSPASNKVLIGRKVPTSDVDLKQVQIRKFHKLVPLDNDWDKLFPDVEEPNFSWSWPNLTEQQIELGKMDFEKFLVVQKNAMKSKFFLYIFLVESDFVCHYITYAGWDFNRRMSLL